MNENDNRLHTAYYRFHSFIVIRQLLYVRDQFGRGMMRQIWDEAHSTAIGQYHPRFGQTTAIWYFRRATCQGVVASLDVDGRSQIFEQRTRRRFAKNGDVIDAGERSQYFGAFVLRH